MRGRKREEVVSLRRRKRRELKLIGRREGHQRRKFVDGKSEVKRGSWSVRE